MIKAKRLISRSMLVMACSVIAFGSNSAAVSAKTPQAIAPSPSPICGSEGSTKFLCSVPKPEDLYALPGTHWLVTTSLEGGIYLIDANSRTSTRIFPSAQAKIRFDRKNFDTCKGPPDAADLAHFNTLGIDVMAKRPGHYRLHVTRYPGDSAIDVLELTMRPNPVVTWIGCVPAPDKILANAIVGTPDGGFMVTSFYETGERVKEARAQAEAGEITGELWSWAPGKGWRKVPGTQSSGTNGLALSPDGKFAYICQWGSKTFMRVSLDASAPRRDIIQLDYRPDNVHWAPDGQLLVVGHTATGGFMAKIDPTTLKVTELLRRQDTPEFSHLTGAAEIGDEIWVGTTKSDRIAIYPLSHDTRRLIP